MDPFGELDDKMMTDMFRKKRDEFLALLSKPSKSEADLAQIREMRKDKFLNVVFLFKDYYELKALSGRTAAQDAQIATIESRYPSIAQIYNDGKLRSMLSGKGRSRRRKLTRRRRVTRKRT